MNPSQSFIRALAIRSFINQNKQMDAALMNTLTDHLCDQQWKNDLASWKQLTPQQKQVFIQEATQWFTNWARKYPRKVSFLLQNWKDVTFE